MKYTTAEGLFTDASNMFDTICTSLDKKIFAKCRGGNIDSFYLEGGAKIQSVSKGWLSCIGA